MYFRKSHGSLFRPSGDENGTGCHVLGAANVSKLEMWKVMVKWMADDEVLGIHCHERFGVYVAY